jgi:hypothetical protein
MAAKNGAMAKLMEYTEKSFQVREMRLYVA